MNGKGVTNSVSLQTSPNVSISDKLSSFDNSSESTSNSSSNSSNSSKQSKSKV